MVRKMTFGRIFMGVTSAWLLTAIAPVTVAQSGTPLPPGGGDPGGAYLACQESIRAGSFEGMLACVSAARAAEMQAGEAGEAEEMFGLIQLMQPTEITVLGGSVDADTAMLNVEGLQEGDKATGTVTMVREGGAWKIEKESWKSGS